MGRNDVDVPDLVGVTFSWPETDIISLRQRYVVLRRRYGSSVHSAQGRRLSLSALLATALERALDEPMLWLPSVRDGRPVTEGPRDRYQRIGVMWPRPLLGRLASEWDRLDEVGPHLWGPTFRLTKAHLALAGILHGLASVDAWIEEVPQDRRQRRTSGDASAGPRA